MAIKGVCRVNLHTLMMKAISGLQRVFVFKGAEGKGYKEVYFHADLAARFSDQIKPRQGGWG